MYPYNSAVALQREPRIAKRTYREWFRDVWLAMKGTTSVSFRLTVFPATEIKEVVIECHSHLNWPLVSNRETVCADLMRFNASSYYPTLLAQTVKPREE